MKFERFSGPGSTPSRRRFWDQIYDYVAASRKLAGRNVSVSEHDDAGSVIDVADSLSKRHPAPTPPSSVCCPDESLTMEVTFTGIVACSPLEDISLNGTFTLTRPDIFTTWTGTGGEFFYPDFGVFPTELTLQCSGLGLTVQYSSPDTGFVFFINSEAPIVNPTPNQLPPCSDPGGTGGTMSWVCE